MTLKHVRGTTLIGLRIGQSIIAGLILVAFAAVTGFSIGLFYFPSAFMMLMAGLLSAPVRKR